MNKKILVLSIVLFILVAVVVFKFSDNTNAIGMTNDEMVADFEYLYSTMKDNYPMFGVVKRLYDVDWLANKDEYIERIKLCENDLQFYNEMQSILGELEKSGHLSLLSPMSYIYMSTKPDKQNRFFMYEENIQTIDVWEKYSKWEKIIPVNYGKENSNREYLETKIVEEGKIAYLRASTFVLRGEASTTATNYTEDDKVLIYNFYNEIKDYDNLIIDIRDNRGGYNYYWQYYLVSPLLKEKKIVDSYSVFKDGDIIKEYVFYMKYATNNMSDFPEELDAPPEIFTDFKYWEPRSFEVLPTNGINFEGKIYLLVNDRVYSAAEFFSQFAKQTKWATIVGRRTGGDAVNDGSFFYNLPNSGLVMMYSTSLTLDFTGRVSEEYGTEPDIWIDNDEDALEKTLEIIANDLNID